MKTPQLLLVIIFLMILSSCSKQIEKRVKEPEILIDSTIVNGKEYDFVFKSWLKDTLITLSSWKSKLEDGIEKKNFSVESDSLTLTIEVYYKSDVNIKSHIEISNMLDLLKEYGELPKKGFISFRYEHLYFPSSVVQLDYEYSYEISDILIELSQHERKKYNFIRGRINNKEVVASDENGNSKIERYDFIWEGDKLIKKKLN